MQITMQTDLMALLEDLLNHFWIGFSGPPGHKKGLLDIVFGKNLENPGNRDTVITQPGVGPHHGVSTPRMGIMRQRIGIDIKSDGYCAPSAIRPLHWIVNHENSFLVDRKSTRLNSSHVASS